MGSPVDPDFDYIVVGSGAGGGPLACNLARAGFKVGLIEAGQSPEPPAYSVPVFHGFASEDPDMSWAFFVRHYDDADRARRDSKYRAEHGGVFYPRAGTLGGCTAAAETIAAVVSRSATVGADNVAVDATVAPATRNASADAPTVTLEAIEAPTTRSATLGAVTVAVDAMVPPTTDWPAAAAKSP